MYPASSAIDSALLHNSLTEMFLIEVNSHHSLKVALTIASFKCDDISTCISIGATLNVIHLVSIQEIIVVNVAPISLGNFCWLLSTSAGVVMGAKLGNLVTCHPLCHVGTS